MIRCISIRKKGSNEQCPCKALQGNTFCGKHARSKFPRIWKNAHPYHTQAAKIQAMIRGWLQRNYLKKCGPGVLHRKNLANDEDLVTCETYDRQYAINYFSFVENGKIWWFDFHSIWTWVRQNHKPTNPYTKVPISVDVLKRLRLMWLFKKRRNTLINNPNTPQELVKRYWNVICQIIEENGFGDDIDPDMFTDFRKRDYYIMYQFIRNDILVSLPKKSRDITRIVLICNRQIKDIRKPEKEYIIYSAYYLMLMLIWLKDPYILCFTILSAIKRL